MPSHPNNIQSFKGKCKSRGSAVTVPALILGIKGLKFAHEHPETKGKAHAWVGIIMGGLFTVVWGGLLIMGLVGAAMGP